MISPYEEYRTIFSKTFSFETSYRRIHITFVDFFVVYPDVSVSNRREREERMRISQGARALFLELTITVSTTLGVFIL